MVGQAVLTRAAQIKHMAQFLDSPQIEGMSCDELAKAIVDAYHKLFTSELTPASPNLHLGEGYKVPWSAKTYFPAWTDGDMMWIVTADSTQGWYGKADSPLWSLVEPSKARTGAPGTNADGWKVGDRLTRLFGSHRYSVLAVSDKSALLRDHTHGLTWAEGNAALERYFTKG